MRNSIRSFCSAAAASSLDTEACWIWAPQVSGANTYVELRCEFNAGDSITEAWLQLSAETSLRLWINGSQVHAGPLREVPPYFYFDTIDLVPYLRRGPNELRIVAHHQGENSQSYQAGTPAILVGGRCLAGSETLLSFAGRKAWQARRHSSYRQEAHRLFGCLGFSERVDFQAREGAWAESVLVANHPWSERPVALGRDLPAWRETVRLPLAQTAEEKGWMIDMGMEVSGYVELGGASSAPIFLRVSYAEALDGGRVDVSKGGMNYFDCLELGTEEFSWRSYEKRAFRYLHLDASVELKFVRVIEQTFPYEPVYQASRSYRERESNADGQLINRILDVSARTIELNTEDLLTDCPWRERAQYLDSHFYMGAIQRLFGTLEPSRRFLHQFARGADEAGLLRMCYPSPAGTTVIPDFSISYAFLLQRYLELSGDLETVRKNILFAGRGILALRSFEDSEGLLTDVPGWIFLDNTFELPKFPRSAGLNAVYYGGHRALATLLRACGEPDQAEDYEVAAVRIRSAFRRTFLQGDRLLDADSTPFHEGFRQWVFHYSAETGRWKGRSFRLRISFRLTEPGNGLNLSIHAGARAWIDGVRVADIKEGGSWTRSAIYERTELATPDDDGWHLLDLEIEWSGIDWECYLSCRRDVQWSAAIVWEEAEYGRCFPEAAPPPSAFQSKLRHHSWPWMSQITVGYAAVHGLLEEGEAKSLLQACLPARYSFPFAKRTTPFFAVLEERAEVGRILPCNVPASMFYFCHALKKYGMAREAKELVLPIYRGMLERGATTWWEEWNTRSSLCHAWGSFVVEFLEEDGEINPARCDP